jgi:vacuolar protein sorting-associated protein 13A/C
MDLSAPIIIIPEDITTEHCRHLVIDAGHIAIESNLADKDAMVKVQSMRKHEYTDADYKRLESLMYDKFTLKLEAAQVCNFAFELPPPDRISSSFLETILRHVVKL